MEKVILLSVECYRNAVFVIGMCSSVYLVSACWDLFLSVVHVVRNMSGEFGAFPHTRPSEEHHSFCIIDKSCFSF